jgi:hypothetical protein
MDGGNMTPIEIDGVTVLLADEGKYLTNGETYGTKVWLGVNDIVSNWYETDEIPAPEELEVI